MNIFRAELFRYRKSFYSRLIYLLIFPCAGIVAIVLKYASTGMSSDFLFGSRIFTGSGLRDKQPYVRNQLYCVFPVGGRAYYDSCSISYYNTYYR